MTTIKQPTKNSVSTFKWRDRYGEYHLPAKMETRHLFYTLRMIWNNAMPASARLPGNLYGFGPFYTKKYMLEAVKVLATELATRQDMTADWKKQLNQMLEWLSTNQIEQSEVLALEGGAV